MFRTIIFLSLAMQVLSQYNYTFVKELDLTKYQGKWIEVYKDLFDESFQKGGSCVTAEYTILDSGNVSVFNTEYLKSGQISNISGYAFYIGDHSGGQLSVHLEGAPIAPYWVVELGPIVDDLYDYSIVSDDKQISLFVLARNIDRFFELYNESVAQSLSKMGFTKFINQPLLVNQSFC